MKLRQCFSQWFRLLHGGACGSGYRDENFGSSVDYAEQYLNTDDPVPTTNDPLPLCACIDVTAAQERNNFELPENESMHCWPLVYFARHGLQDSAGKMLIHTVKTEIHFEDQL